VALPRLSVNYRFIRVWELGDGFCAGLDCSIFAFVLTCFIPVVALLFRDESGSSRSHGSRQSFVVWKKADVE
jgi:hypothetical protein